MTNFINKINEILSHSIFWLSLHFVKAKILCTMSDLFFRLNDKQIWKAELTHWEKWDKDFHCLATQSFVAAIYNDPKTFEVSNIKLC